MSSKARPSPSLPRFTAPRKDDVKYGDYLIDIAKVIDSPAIRKKTYVLNSAVPLYFFCYFDKDGFVTHTSNIKVDIGEMINRGFINAKIESQFYRNLNKISYNK